MADNIKVLKIDTGAAQTSVKDLRNELKELRSTLLSTKKGTEEYNKTLKQAAEIQHTLKEQMEEVNASAMDFGQIASNCTKAVGGLVGGFQAATAVMNLFGAENEDVIKTLKTMQQLMALTQALPAIDNGVKAFKRLALAIQASSTALKGLSTAAIATGLGAIAVAIGVLSNAFSRLREKQDKYIEKQKEYIRIQKEKQIQAQKEYNEALQKELDLKERLLNIRYAGNDVETYATILGEYQKQLNDVEAALKDTYREAERLEAKKVLRQLKKDLKNLSDTTESYIEKLIEISAQEDKISKIKPYSPEEIENLKQRQTELNDKISEYAQKLEEARKILREQRKLDEERITYQIAIIQREFSNLFAVDGDSLQDLLLAKFGGMGVPIPIQPVIEEEDEDEFIKQADDLKTKIYNTVETLRQAFKTPEEQYAEEQSALEIWYNTQVALYKDNEQKKLEIQEEYNRLSGYLAEEHKQLMQQKAAQEAQVWMSALGNLGNIFASMADMIDNTSEEGKEKYRALMYTSTIISMLAGIGGAIASAFNPANAYLTIFGQIAMAAATSMSVLTSGIAQLTQIKNANENSTLGGGGLSESPSTAAIGTFIAPVQYTQDVQGANIEGAIRDSKVYVTETDITRTQNKVRVSESEARF